MILFDFTSCARKTRTEDDHLGPPGNTNLREVMTAYNDEAEALELR